MLRSIFRAGSSFSKVNIMIAAAVMLTVGTGHALIIHDPAYTASTTNPSMYAEQPADDFGWDYVGRVGVGSAVYLGHGWVLGTNHVGAGSLILHGTTHLRDTTEPVIRLKSPGGDDVDLILFKLQSPPNLAPLSIAQNSPAVGTGVAMAGTGLVRGSAFKSFFNPDNRDDGYDWSASRASPLVWGPNTVYQVPAEPLSYGYGPTHVFTTQFTRNAGVQTQATQHDSGGGVFTKNSEGQWVLSGSMLTINDSPYGNASVFGDVTYSADLSVYRDQIMTVIPEPSTLVFMAAGALLFVLRRRVRPRRV